MKITPSIYVGPNQLGDFMWMINRPEYSTALFIFNDNTESKHSCRPGKGNAIIRQYTKNNETILVPRAAGIPTGSLRTRGFKSLSPEIKMKIDDALNDIINLCLERKYTEIVYSADSSGLLGQNLFKIDMSVRRYITEEIYKLADII